MGPGEEEGARPSHSQSRGALPPGHPDFTAHLLFPFFSDTTTAWVCIFLFGVFRLCQRDAAKTWGFTSDTWGIQLSFVGITDSRTTFGLVAPGKGDFYLSSKIQRALVHFGRERSTKLAFSRASRGATSELGTAAAAVSPNICPGPLGLRRRWGTKTFWLRAYFFTTFSNPRLCVLGAQIFL